MKIAVVFCVLALAAAAAAQQASGSQPPQAPVVAAEPGAAPAPVKVATIFAQNAIVSTQEGQKATAQLNAKYAPRKDEFDRKQREIQALRDQLKKNLAGMNAAARQRNEQLIDDKSKELQRLSEDSQAALEEEEGSLLQQLGDKLLGVIGDYAMRHGYALVLDVSNPQGPVLWASPAVDITNEIVKLYDQTHPSPAVPPAAPPTKKQ
jgi:outer membrane protein